MRLILIAVFGAVGTLARYGLQGFVQVRTGGTFPYGTLLINLSGCFLLGLIGQFTLNRLVISPDWRVAIASDGRPRRCWRTASGYRQPHTSLRASLLDCCCPSQGFA